MLEKENTGWQNPIKFENRGKNFATVTTWSGKVSRGRILPNS